MRISDWSSDVCSSDLRAGTTFRKLPDADKAGLDEAKAIALMVAQPSMIKRPVVGQGGELLVGFKPERYAAMFGESKTFTRTYEEGRGGKRYGGTVKSWLSRYL